MSWTSCFEFVLFYRITRITRMFKIYCLD